MSDVISWRWYYIRIKKWRIDYSVKVNQSLDTLYLHIRAILYPSSGLLSFPCTIAFTCASNRLYEGNKKCDY